VQTAQQDAEAARLRSAGVTYRDIAEALGICDASSARKCVERALLATVAEPAEELRRLELMKLDQLSVAARRRTGLERHRVGAASGSGPFPPGAHPLAVRWNTSGLGRSTADKRRHASVGSGIFRSSLNPALFNLQNVRGLARFLISGVLTLGAEPFRGGKVVAAPRPPAVPAGFGQGAGQCCAAGEDGQRTGTAHVHSGFVTLREVVGGLTVASGVEQSPAAYTSGAGEVGCRSQCGEQVVHCGRYSGRW